LWLPNNRLKLTAALPPRVCARFAGNRSGSWKALSLSRRRSLAGALVGTPAMSQIDIAEALSEQLGRQVAAEVVPLEAWERGARASGLGDYQVLTLIKMFRYYESYGFMGNSNALSCLLRRQPTSFADFVKRMVNERENALRVS
ncbi:MAG: hypothetical protein Q7U34_15375, partial [Anaerolineales bacterium]|nr:hypothetical protein [Anaerolineales bacterium]